MEEKNYIYFYYIDDKLMYVGRTKDVWLRYKQHCNEKEKYNKINKIKVAQCQTKTDMIFYEIYYINKFLPPWNSAMTDFGKPSFELNELLFKTYSIQSFEKEFKPNAMVKQDKKKVKKERVWKIKEHDVEIPKDFDCFQKAWNIFKEHPDWIIKIGNFYMNIDSSGISKELLGKVIDDIVEEKLDEIKYKCPIPFHHSRLKKERKNGLIYRIDGEGLFLSSVILRKYFPEEEIGEFYLKDIKNDMFHILGLSL